METGNGSVLGRVNRSQYGSGDAVDVSEALAALGDYPRPHIEQEQRLATFLNRLQRNKIELAVVPNRSKAVVHIGRLIYREHQSHRAVAGHDRRLAAMPWRDGGVLVRFGAATGEDLVSISHARFAVAETGSLVLYCNRDNPAANNWLTRDHIVILDAGDLVATLDDAWAGIRKDWQGQAIPRGIAFISGPSSTGDIIGHMVQGAHGPQRLHLVLLGEVAEELLQRTGHVAAPATR